jgi:hypothetical protein
MKIFLPSADRSGGKAQSRAFPGCSKRCREQGMAIIVVFTLIAIVLIYLSFNLRTLHLVDREIKLIDKQQTRRLQLGFPPPAIPTGTNQAPAR